MRVTEQVFMSPSTATVIDFVQDGRSCIEGETLEEIRRRHPDAEEMTFDRFMAWKGERQRTPITWEETTVERYEEMLCVLPPAYGGWSGFLVGEPADHCATTGRPRFDAFREVGGRFLAASRPMTVEEFKAECAK